MPAKSGDTVRVHYTGKLDDGTVFDSSDGRDPIEFTIGSGQVIPGFDSGVTDMEVGDKKSITIGPEDAYGPVRDDLIQQLGKEQFPEGADLQPGVQFQAQTQDGQPFVLTVTEVQDETVTVDGNHPLAGKALNFELELAEIV